MDFTGSGINLSEVRDLTLTWTSVRADRLQTWMPNVQNIYPNFLRPNYGFVPATLDFWSGLNVSKPRYLKVRLSKKPCFRPGGSSLLKAEYLLLDGTQLLLRHRMILLVFNISVDSDLFTSHDLIDNFNSTYNLFHLKCSHVAVFGINQFRRWAHSAPFDTIRPDSAPPTYQWRQWVAELSCYTPPGAEIPAKYHHIIIRFAFIIAEDEDAHLCWAKTYDPIHYSFKKLLFLLLICAS